MNILELAVHAQVDAIKKAFEGVNTFSQEKIKQFKMILKYLDFEWFLNYLKKKNFC